MLIFDQPRLEHQAAGGAYQVLTDAGVPLTSYTVRAVAGEFHLHPRTGGSRELLQHLLDFHHRIGLRPWSMDDFVEARRPRLPERGRELPPSVLRDFFSAELEGHYIIGTMDPEGGHFLNIQIYGDGQVEGYDPQNGKKYIARDIRSFGDIQLFIRLSSG
jgi:hypothetical protein